MKRWQVLVLVIFGVAAAGAVIIYPPGSRRIASLGIPMAPSASPARSSQPISLLFVGDVMLSRSVGRLMAERDDWRWPFERIASVTAAADLTFGNLETTVSTRGKAAGCGFCFRADPRAVQGLVYAGFDVMSVANNHIWDYGPDAFSDTLSALLAVGIDPIGGGRNEAEARTPVVRTVRGVRVAYLAYTDLLPASASAQGERGGANRWDDERMKEDIAAARAQADIVVVSFHTGTEYQTAHNATQERIYREAVDAGADLVIAHHPHVVQEVEKYKRGWIAYSLGNFVFDQNFSGPTMRGLMLRVRVIGGIIDRVDPIPVDISRQYQPSLAR